jgi:hypothetical protein
MDKADEELKESIKKLWPLLNVKKLNLLVPPKDGKILKKITHMLHIFKFSFRTKRINF